MPETVTIKLDDKARQGLHRLALLTERSVEELVDQAIRNYLELQEWQRPKIEAGVAAAEPVRVCYRKRNCPHRR